ARSGSSWSRRLHPSSRSPERTAEHCTPTQMSTITITTTITSMSMGGSDSTAGAPPPLGSQLALLRLASPGLPVGAFSYSRGLEPAVAAGWGHDGQSAGNFILGVLERSICPLEGAILVRLHGAWSAHDAGSVRAWTLWLRAAR